MKMKEEKVVTVYLTDAQIRLVKHAVGKECHYLRIPFDTGTNVEYGVGIDAGVDAPKMYLTNWQRREIMDEAGEACEFIEVVEPRNVRYGVPV